MSTAAIRALPEAPRMWLPSQFGDQHKGLRAVTECIGSSVVVHVGGDIDAHNEGVWQRLVTRSGAIAIGPGPFVVDVRELDFIGSCGYVVLAQEAVRCRRRGVNLRLVANQPIVARTIAACGLRRLLPMFSTVDTALSQGVSDKCRVSAQALTRWT